LKVRTTLAVFQVNREGGRRTRRRRTTKKTTKKRECLTHAASSPGNTAFAV